MEQMIHSAIPKLMLFMFWLLLTGCATTSEVSDKDGNSDYGEYYDGQSELIYSNKESPATAIEIIAMGDAVLAQGKQDEALYQYVKAIDLDNTSDTALYKIAGIHSNRGNAGLAKKAYEMVLEINPDHSGAHAGLGLLYLNKAHYDEARSHLLIASANDTMSDWRVFNSLGVISDLQKEYAHATLYYEKALALQPVLPVILNNMGYSRYMLGDWDSAEKFYKKAVLNNRSFERAWRNLGLLYSRKQNYDEAVNAFAQVEELPEAYNDVGFICMLDGKHDIAEDYFNKAIKLSPRYFEKANNNLQKNRQLSSN